MPTPEVRDFQSAIELASDERKPHLLLGNGFSRACRNEIFAYSALFERADFNNLSRFARRAFEVLNTTDFEVVMQSLRNASKLVRLYDRRNPQLAQRLSEDAEGLKEILVNAIASSHPDMPGDIDQASYVACRNFLSNFERIYTLNYDLLLYWALMQDLQPAVPGDDGFRTPEDGAAEYVTWEIENTHRQNVFYLHGALHLFDAGTELQKYTWINTGIRLMEQIRDALERGLYPLFVAEGQSAKKVERINHSNYLSRGYRSFASIGGTLFVYGHSFADNDQHFLRLIEKGKIRRLFVSLHGNPRSRINSRTIRKAENIKASRPRRRPLEVYYYNATGARVWG